MVPSMNESGDGNEHAAFSMATTDDRSNFNGRVALVDRDSIGDIFDQVPRINRRAMCNTTLPVRDELGFAVVTESILSTGPERDKAIWKNHEA
jgi:hypothetical protein